MSSTQTAPVARRLIARRLKGLSRLIGNTPLLAIDLTLPRPAADALRQGREPQHDRQHQGPDGAAHPARGVRARACCGRATLIVEATSGNTGISFAAIGRALGHPVTHLHARLDEPRAHRPDPQPRRARSAWSAARRAASSAASAWPRSWRRRSTGRLPAAPVLERGQRARRTRSRPGPEIWWQLRFRGLRPDAFVAGVGTGGTIMGVGPLPARACSPASRLHPLEPANSPTLSTGHKVGKHRIQGISDEFIPPIVDLGDLDRVVSVDDGDAILMAQQAGRRARPRRRDLLRREPPRRAEGAGRAGRRRGRRHGLPRRQQEVPEHRPAAARSR